jgi:hypothetical protein
VEGEYRDIHAKTASLNRKKSSSLVLSLTWPGREGRMKHSHIVPEHAEIARGLNSTRPITSNFLFYFLGTNFYMAKNLKRYYFHSAASTLNKPSKSKWETILLFSRACYIISINVWHEVG